MSQGTPDIAQVKKQVQEVISKMGDQIPAKAIPLIEEAVAKIVAGNELPSDALGMTPEVMEVIYQQGYNFFQNGKYQDALVIFNVLRYLDITDSRYTFAIAACYHYMKEYMDAAANYMIYHQMDPFNPETSFHLYDCFKKANYPSSALFYIQEALVLAGREPKYAPLKEKIQLESEHFNEVLKKHYQEKYGSDA